ncbi:hypothetical protein RhiJN_02776 [Ceratobasidium sp. AG-Ba]|nr:hypothetical protein RhiJN_02776 [Ceratobasidium sp. AG-Ba]QRW03668.1 hypothetical protein RhiLY_02667 [Ceratobasidium sp. AG-Ba]
MADSANPIEELKVKLASTFSDLLGPQSSLSPEKAAEQIVAIAKAYVDEHSNDPVDPNAVRRNSGPKRDTPGAETFFWSLWECLVEAISEWNSEATFRHNLGQAIALVKALQAQPDEPKWTIWGEDTSIKALPLVGPSLREANNGPLAYLGPDDDALARPEVQNALAGAPPATLVKDENIDLAVLRRKNWLAFQGFMAKLWAEAGLESFAVCSIWAVRDGLEDWPAAPPPIFDQTESEEERPVGEETPAYRVLLAEGAAMWFVFAAPQMYACTEIWGPNGNPDWPSNKGAPGRGGERWQGVDGMDKEKQRWALWREVLKDVVAWHDREEVAGRGVGWRVKYIVAAALEEMYKAQQK